MKLKATLQLADCPELAGTFEPSCVGSSDELGIHILCRSRVSPVQSSGTVPLSIAEEAKKVFIQHFLEEKIVLENLKRDHNQKNIQNVADAIERAAIKTKKNIQPDEQNSIPSYFSFALVLVCGKTAIFCRSGDPRAYLLRNGKLILLTPDPPAGDPSLTGFQCDFVQAELRSGDLILLSSPGIWERWPATLDFQQVVAEALETSAGSTQAIATRLLETSTLADDAIIVISCENPEQPQSGLELNSRLDILRKIPFFSKLSLVGLTRLLSQMKVRDFEASETLITERDKSSDFYVLLAGRAEVSNQNVVLSEMNAGNFFGEMSLIDGHPRVATVRSKQPGTLLILSQEKFRELIGQDPVLGTAILLEFCQILCQRLRNQQTSEPVPSITLEIEK